jgi:PAS domain S-box-containing protein
LINFINEAAAGLLGYQVKELVGKHFLEFIHAEDSERVNKTFSQQLQGIDQGSTLEFRVVTAGGQTRWINFMVNRAVDNGRVIGLMGVALDITERKRAEEAQRQSETRYGFMVDKVPFAIISFDPRYNILEWNRAAERIFGWSREEVVGRNEFELIIPEKNMEEMKQLLDSYAQGSTEIKSNINQNLRKDGTIITCRWQDVIIRDSEGGVEGILATAIDVTEQARLEEQLNQAQKLESVGRLAGGMAHDFNNLLTTILGYSELISMDQSLNDTVAEGIEDIRKSAERGARLIRQLLAFSRKQILQPRLINLNELITDLEKMLKRLIEENIDLITKLEPEIKQIEADPVQIEQVIMNLAVNSRDAMAEGGKLIIETGNIYLDEDYCRVHSVVQPGDYVMLAVSDNGHGMDEETRRQVFDPFFTTKEVGKGTGLGLATVYGIVKQSGGYVWVYSEPDQGTTFKIYLPQIKEDQDRRTEVPKAEEAAGGKETLLLVEDEGSLRELAAKVLRKNGYAVIEAANGIEALETVAASSQPKIDLLITDVIMPEMGGKELSGKILARYPGTKVLYISGYTDNAIVHHGVLAEGVSFLPKPFSAISLAQKVRDTLDGG